MKETNSDEDETNKLQNVTSISGCKLHDEVV